MTTARATIRKRTTHRGRKVQGTFHTILPWEDESAPDEFPVLDFKSFPYRTALANWPDQWRERWGYRANALEDAGLSWQDAEARAFFEVQDERRAEVGILPIPLASPHVGRN
jgi:hypothetical protein